MKPNSASNNVGKNQSVYIPLKVTVLKISRFRPSITDFPARAYAQTFIRMAVHENTRYGIINLRIFFFASATHSRGVSKSLISSVSNIPDMT